jgi:hypothetical protein
VQGALPWGPERASGTYGSSGSGSAGRHGRRPGGLTRVVGEVAEGSDARIGRMDLPTVEGEGDPPVAPSNPRRSLTGGPGTRPKGSAARWSWNRQGKGSGRKCLAVIRSGWDRGRGIKRRGSTRGRLGHYRQARERKVSAHGGCQSRKKEEAQHTLKRRHWPMKRQHPDGHDSAESVGPPP